MNAIHASFILLKHFLKVLYALHLLHQLGVQAGENHWDFVVSQILGVLGQLLQRFFIYDLSVSETDH